jgi:hypothetical protein
MPNTSRGYPYPLSSAPADVPADLQLLANALNTDVGAVSQTDTDNTVLTIMGAWL